MKALILSAGIWMLGMALQAQGLYFIRGIATSRYSFDAPSPVHLIKYMPDTDSVLRVYRDYTGKLKGLDDVRYYGELDMIYLSSFGSPRRYYLINTHQTDTLFEVVPQCPDGYVMPLTLRVIDNNIAYDCHCHSCSKDSIFLTKGITLSRYLCSDCPDSTAFIYQGIKQYSTSSTLTIPPSDYRNLYLTGYSYGDGGEGERLVTTPDDGKLLLPEVADISKRPPLSIELPEEYWFRKKAFIGMAINNTYCTVIKLSSVNPKKNESVGSRRLAIYNKKQQRWFDMTLDGNSSSINSYGYWIAGMVNDIATDRFLPDRESPGRAQRTVPDIFFSFDEYAGTTLYCPGILYLINIDTQKYIEWNTEQGDSEILLVEDETVYYRVFDAIYRAPIINGERLGNPELLVKDNRAVPYIHWAFTGR